ncbi:MAG: FAD-dependent oxidoreductase [Lachnospiraceae bacterium]|nr:FAD-dependent oxidoreductase [Lachnospiraceae bacterium]
MSERFDIVIVGAGTAGLSAAIYATRSGKKALVLEEMAYGGQIINTPEVANYPGIAKISGFDFAQGLYDQATGLGAEVRFEFVSGAEKAEKGFVITTDVDTYEAGALILATGAKNRPLGMEHEEEWIGSGVSYCATCDGAFFKGKDVAVAGGGNTALEDAIFLTEYCNKVYLIHRRDELRGEKHLQDTLRKKENAEFVLNVSIDALLGEDRLSGVAVTDKATGAKRDIIVDGLFVAIGQMPANKAFSNLVTLDDKGYIVAGEDCKTTSEGVFAAGDCRTKEVRQLTTAAADGAVAALAACSYLQEKE